MYQAYHSPGMGQTLLRHPRRRTLKRRHARHHLTISSQVEVTAHAPTVIITVVLQLAWHQSWDQACSICRSSRVMAEQGCRSLLLIWILAAAVVVAGTLLGCAHAHGCAFCCFESTGIPLLSLMGSQHSLIPHAHQLRHRLLVR